MRMHINKLKCGGKGLRLEDFSENHPGPRADRFTTNLSYTMVTPFSYGHLVTRRNCNYKEAMTSSLLLVAERSNGSRLILMMGLSTSSTPSDGFDELSLICAVAASKGECMAVPPFRTCLMAHLCASTEIENERSRVRRSHRAW